MTNTNVSYQELRFDVRNPEHTDVYVFVEITGGEHMAGVQGWHHKRFPASTPTVDIANSLWKEGGEDPLLWPRKNPQVSEGARAAEALAAQEQDFMDAAVQRLTGPFMAENGVIHHSDGLRVSTYPDTPLRPDMHANWFEFSGGRLYMILKYQMGSPEKEGINGATMEAVLSTLIYRLRVFEERCPSEYNRAAIGYLEETMNVLEFRKEDREKRGVIGTAAE